MVKTIIHEGQKPDLMSLLITKVKSEQIKQIGNLKKILNE